jgi:hypothetical protein
MMPYNTLKHTIKMKLLVVDLQNPNRTKYHNPNDIDSFFWGRHLINYPMFTVSENGELKQIVLETADVTEIKKRVMDELK